MPNIQHFHDLDHLLYVTDQAIVTDPEPPQTSKLSRQTICEGCRVTRWFNALSKKRNHALTHIYPALEMLVRPHH